MVPHTQDITLIIDTQDTATVIPPRELTSVTITQGTIMVMATWDITLAIIIQGTTMVMATLDITPHITTAMHTQDITAFSPSTPDTTMAII